MNNKTEKSRLLRFFFALWKLYKSRKKGKYYITEKKNIYKLSMDDICCCQFQEKENIKNKIKKWKYKYKKKEDKNIRQEWIWKDII